MFLSHCDSGHGSCLNTVYILGWECVAYDTDKNIYIIDTFLPFMTGWMTGGGYVIFLDHVGSKKMHCAHSGLVVKFIAQ